MIRVTKVLPAGLWDRAAEADKIELPHDGRHRRRVAMRGAADTAFLLDLDEATLLRDGDGLQLEDGRVVRVVAAAEPILEITGEKHLLARLAWHLGNRHVPAQIFADRIHIGRDHVLEEMLMKLGGHVARIEAPFDPESGAYAHAEHAHRVHDHHDHDHTIMATVTNTPTGTAMAAKGRATADVTPLLVWLSPSFPVGSFAYSHGLEWAVEAGDVRDAVSLELWLSDLLHHGGSWSDAVLLAHTHRAATSGDDAKLAEVAALAAALAPSRERRMETLAQGAAFLAAVRAAWPSPALERAKPFEREIAFPVAMGLASASCGLALAPTLEAYLVAMMTNLVSAAVRLIPLGQTDGTRVVAKLAPLAKRAAALAAAAPIDDIGGAALRSDLASMRHETQYTRLFRS